MFNKKPEAAPAASTAAPAAAKEAKPAVVKEKAIVKGALPATIKRPTRDMFRKIQKVKEPPTVKERWGNYRDGMTILEVIEGDNMAATDISWYAKNGYVTLIEPTEDEFQAGAAAWYKRNGIDNPADVKAKAAQEKADAAAAAKAKKEADAKAKADAAAAAKAKADAAKAAKTA